MSAAWHMGPSYSPFNHTSNSQYGAWSGTGYGGGSSVTRKVGGTYVPTPPAPRISDVTAKDVAKIVSAVDPVTGATKEKFSDFMSRYGSGRITPLTSQYDRVMAVHDAATPKWRQSHTPGNSPEPDIGTSIGRSVHNEIIATAKNIPVNYSSSQRYGTYPSRLSDGKSQEARDFQFQRSQSNVDSQLDSVRRYSDMSDTTTNMKRTDSNNNLMNSNGYRSEPTKSYTRPALNRSNTFSGMSSQSEGLASRYAETRVGLDNLFTKQSRDLPRNSDSRYLSPGMRSSGSGDIIDTSSHTASVTNPREYQSQISPRSRNGDVSSELHGRDYDGRDYLTNRESGRDSSSRPTENGIDNRNSMYWLYGKNGRSGYDGSTGTIDNSSRSANGSVTPYRSGEYLKKLENESSTRQYSNYLRDDARRDYGSSQETSYSERLKYTGIRPATPYSNHLPDDPYGLDSTQTVTDPADLRAPDVISRHSGVQKSILKKRSSHADSGSSFGGASSYHDPYTPQYRNTSMGLQDTKQLPPLSSYTASATLRRDSSGKKVTFNLAKNKFRAILD